MITTIRSITNRNESFRNAIDYFVLLFFWFIFYFPIWSGARHVGWDLDGFNYPLDRFLLDGLNATHHLPTWDWFEYNGIDFSGDIQAAAFYPPKLFLLTVMSLLGIPLTYSFYQVFALLHILAFSVTTYWVGRLLSLPRFYCVVGALCLAYTGILQAQIEHFWFVGILPWIPLCAYFGYRATTTNATLPFYLYVLFSTCMFLVGYPPQYLTIQVEIMLFVALMQLFTGSGSKFLRSGRAVLTIALGQVCTCLLSSAMLLPFIVLARGSIADAYGRTYPIQTLLTAILPDAFGHLSGKLTYETDPTTSYMFLGLFLEIAIVLLPLSFRSMRVRPELFIVPGILVFANLLLMVSPFSDFMHDHAPSIALLRPQSGGMPFAVAFTAIAIAIFVYAEREANGRYRLIVRAGAVLAALSLFVNRPGYFNTPTQSAAIVEPASLELIANGVPDPTYSLAIDQSTIGGPGDDWPRVFHMRSLGGEDPLAQKSYLDELDSQGLHNSGRRVFFSTDADLRWLEQNGVGFVMTGNPQFKLLAERSGFAMLQPPPFTIYRLPHALPVASATCATVEGTSFGWDEISISYNARASCAMRLTTNYSPFFSTRGSETIEPVAGGLGMIVSNLTPGRNTLRIFYENPYSIVGNMLTLLATLALFALLYYENRNKRLLRAGSH